VADKFPRAVLTRSFDYGAEMHILMKDIDLAVAKGEALGVTMCFWHANPHPSADRGGLLKLTKSDGTHIQDPFSFLPELR